MRFLLTILLIAVFGFIAGLFLPWWSIAVVAFIVLILLPQGLGRSFLAGFLGIFLLWFAIAFIQDMKNDHILSRRIAELFKLGPASLLLILITAFIGGLVAGFAAMSGSSLRSARK
jgi:hypothetical protein